MIIVVICMLLVHYALTQALWTTHVLRCWLKIYQRTKRLTSAMKICTNN
jgi:hypothetical protein